MIEFRVVACVLIASACAAEPELASVEQENNGEWCSSQLCNSEEVMYRGVWEASLWGQPALNGVYLKRTKYGHAAIYKDGIAYGLRVWNGRISGSDLYFGSISGDQLVGARLVLMREGKLLYNITITRVRREVRFVDPPHDLVETYTMQWHTDDSAPTGKPVCTRLHASPGDKKYFHMFDMLENETVVFEGERFNPDNMTVDPMLKNDWFNFGCAGHTLAKLYLLGYTAKSVQVESHAQRQAMLKMMVGDYCGKGTTFTRAGEPIAWKGGHHPIYPGEADLTSPEPPLDARWNENGALCILQPRMQTSTHPDWPIEFQNPDALTRIRDACALAAHPLPTCVDPDPQHLDGARVISANRVPI